MSVSESQTRAAAGEQGRARSSRVRAGLRLAALLGASLFLLCCWIVVKATVGGDRRLYALAAHWTHRWVRWCRRAAGIRLTVHGPRPPAGSLIAPNHLGYADVLAVGSATPCFFVAKIDVESWPLIGLLFRISQNIGVPRSRAKALVEVTRSVANRLTNGQSVCVFLEGTSTGGDRLLPFYPPLAQPGIDAQAPVVPVALYWSADDPAVSVEEDVAYWKEHVFVSHAWRVLGLNGIRCDVTFGDPIDPTDHTRKSLAATVQEAVSRLTGLPVKDPV